MPKRRAQLPNIGPFHRRQHHKFQPRVHPGHLAERHPTASLIRCRKCPRCLRTPVHLVPGLNTRTGRGSERAVAPHISVLEGAPTQTPSAFDISPSVAFSASLTRTPPPNRPPPSLAASAVL